MSAPFLTVIRCLMQVRDSLTEQLFHAKIAELCESDGMSHTHQTASFSSNALHAPASSMSSTNERSHPDVPRCNR